MQNFYFTSIRLNRALILCLSCLVTLQALAQENESPKEKIRQLRSAQDFNSQDSDYIDLLIDLARTKIRSNSDSTIILLKEAYELSVSANYRKGESASLSSYGYYFSEKGEFKKAHKYNQNALEIANTYNLDRQKTLVLINMGNDYGYQGDHANSLTNYLEALEISQKTNDVEIMSILNVNIAELYNENEDYETALTFYKIANKLSVIHGNRELFAQTLLNMSTIYTEKGELDIARSMVEQCIPVFKKENRIDWLSFSYEQKGKIVFKQKNYKEALKWFKKAEVLCNELNLNIGYMGTYRGLAESYFELKNLNHAEEYALKALKISKALNVSNPLKESNLILSKIYKEKGNVTKAFEYQSEYISLYEKGSTEKFKKGLGVLRSEMKFNSQKMALIEENNKAIAQQKFYVYLALAALLIVSLFLILIFRTHKLQKKFTAELSDSNATKDKLFSVIAHDLKGPINSFYSLMKLYMDKEFSKEETEHLFPKALDDIHNISDMLNNLLLWAKTQMQGTTIKQQNIDINKIAHDNLLLLSPLAEKKNIKISNNIAEDTLSFSDRDHIDIVLRNLISNAIKFTNSHGEINISATEQYNYLEIEVSDNGVGMDLETQSKLFEKNNTKSTYGTNNEKGTGLGLSLCKDMVEGNGGKIWVSSIKDKGTTIFFTMSRKQEYLKAI